VRKTFAESNDNDLNPLPGGSPERQNSRSLATLFFSVKQKPSAFGIVHDAMWKKAKIAHAGGRKDVNALAVLE
jgi:hypothetical protein